MITGVDPKKIPDVIRDLLGTNISHLWLSNATVSRIGINNFLYINMIPIDIFKRRFNSWRIFSVFSPLLVCLFSPLHQSHTFSRKNRGTSSMCVCGDFK